MFIDAGEKFLMRILASPGACSEPEPASTSALTLTLPSLTEILGSVATRCCCWLTVSLPPCTANWSAARLIVAPVVVPLTSSAQVDVVTQLLNPFAFVPMMPALVLLVPPLKSASALEFVDMRPVMVETLVVSTLPEVAVSFQASRKLACRVPASTSAPYRVLVLAGVALE